MADLFSQLDIAAELIRATKQEELRRAAVRNRSWAKPLRGFRPQTLTKDLALSRAGEFAAAPGLLKELAEVFLKSNGVAEDGRLEGRLAAAAQRTDLPDTVRAICAQLAGTGDTGTPATPPSVAAETPPQEPEKPAPRPRRRTRVAADEPKEVRSLPA